MNYKFLISKIMYNLYDCPEYPKIIRIVGINKDYTNFTYLYYENNIIYENKIDIENLFKYFNILKPELVISIKRIKNKIYLVLNRYRGEDEEICKEVCCKIDLLKTKLDKNCCLEYFEYILIENDKSIKIKDSKTLDVRYVYYNDDINNILRSILSDKDIIDYIIIPIYEFISKIFNLFTIDNENAIKNILYLNENGKDFLSYISNKIIDFKTINIDIYNYKCNIRKLIKIYKNLLLIKYKNTIYMITFKEKKILDRTENESGFTQDELKIFLSKV